MSAAGVEGCTWKGGKPPVAFAVVGGAPGKPAPPGLRPGSGPAPGGAGGAGDGFDTAAGGPGTFPFAKTCVTAGFGENFAWDAGAAPP